jgi:hypothetical protein
MEGPDEVGGDEVSSEVKELERLTQALESQLSSFGFTGGRVSGSVGEGGFIVGDEG